jgi:hypothetical protein
MNSTDITLREDKEDCPTRDMRRRKVEERVI